MNSEQSLNYYSILGLTPGAGIDSIKKAYRAKARQFHPDINHTSGASDMFILVNEAYEYLLALPFYSTEPIKNYDIEWQERRRQEAKERGYRYAKKSYEDFTKTNNYKSARIYDFITILIAFTIAVIMISMSLYGYFWQLAAAKTDLEKPSLPIMLITLTTGLTFPLLFYFVS